jgi:ABC-2 type transport system ATP-binding protein
MLQNEVTVEAAGVTRAYGARTALDGFTLVVPAHSVFGLLGPNGSGKSTFITMVAAMDRPEQGELRVFGQAPAPGLRARVGVVFQENTADPMMRVDETLGLATRLFGLSGSRGHARAQQLLEEFGLAARAHDLNSTLSGGMRRRLEMARALLHDPELLLLDEPTTGVDPDERRALWDALLKNERGSRTVILATNDLNEADAVCDHVAFIQQGRVVAAGTPVELKRGLEREAVRVTWESPTPEQLQQVEAWAGAGHVTREANLVHITVNDASAFVPRLFELAPGAIRAVSIEKSSLEDAYFRHVSRRERQPEAVA